MNISVIGLGKLGCPLATWIASKGHTVIGVDAMPDVVASVNEGVAPVDETGLQELLVSSGKFTATTDAQQAVLDTDITFVIVPTPSIKDGEFDIKYVKDVAVQIGLALKEKDCYHLVVITSTVMPGHTQHILETLETFSHKECGKDFGLCYNPEFIALGSVLRDLTYPDFVLIGESDDKAGRTLEDFYWQCHNDNIQLEVVYRTSFVNAEIAKLALNCFVTMKISFANMLARLCEHLPGADVDEVTGAIGLDSRIGKKYLKGGAPFGGPCFPRDNTAFTDIRFPKPPAILWDLPVATRRENYQMLSHIIDKVQEYARPGDTVGIIGTAYKPGTVVQEKSTGKAIERFLQVDGRRKVITYDPCAECTSSLRDILTRANVIVVTLPFKEVEGMYFTDCVVIDCWRVVEEDQLGEAVTYIPIGRYHE